MRLSSYCDNMATPPYNKDMYHGRTNILLFDISTLEMLLHKDRWSSSIYVLTSHMLVIVIYIQKKHPK